MGMIRFLAIAVLVCAMFASPVRAEEFFRIRSELQPERPLGPGEFSWEPDAAAKGELVLVVDLKAQLLHAYRAGYEVGRATISSGRKGHETPPGVFRILEKNMDHYSDSYDLSPMPFMQRLTWDGIALHGGKVPGHPASHGCIRLPEAFAQILFHETRMGGKVIVAPDWSGTASTYVVAWDADPAQMRLDALER